MKFYCIAIIYGWFEAYASYVGKSGYSLDSGA